MKKVIISLMFISLLSCRAITPANVLGQYEHSSKYSWIEIQLTENKEFKYERIDLGVAKECNGSWSIKSKNSVIVECNNDDATIEDILSTGYIDSLKKDIVFINKNKIKMDNMVLKRKR